MSQRITIKDVARKAGVSVATVSYVMNNRTDIRISDATRKKVLQISNLLGYTPNRSAQALATSRKRLLAMYFAPEVSVLKRAEQMYIMDFLSSFLHEKNYGLTYLSSAYTDRYDQADAIVCYDTPADYFLEVGDRNFVPLLALDCLLPDNGLFFQINSDYEKIAGAAASYFHGTPYTLLMLDTPNAEKKKLLSEAFPRTVYVSDPKELSACQGQPLLILEHSLYTLFAPGGAQPENLCYLPLISQDKAEALFRCMEYALERTSDVPHDVRI